ncbi:hypothetical protein TNCV_7391 [Trichonephila clavipes]|nr:hypothetical protein TNCV_7391 [Trichonephila clavipes]
MNMSRCMNTELTNFHFIYGLGNGNGRVAVWLYGKIYPTRQQSNQQTFAWVHQNLVEHGSFRTTIEDTPANFEIDLVARISIATATIHETPDIFEHVRQSMLRRCRARILANGRNFKHLL